MTGIPQPSTSLLKKRNFKDMDKDNPQVIENTKLVIVEFVMIVKH